ncbi:hypothetical protein PP939_gp256 [Rhizobium phage RL38J1]|uniref:Uncharacterized protein n=1 Tax=Rhizobium phage RL38J1 TaxID=2663232 RepID=A0A6B9JCW1_9CAUD|nr:hypothetical protein PP939_gp256 [Rhizobium phage RL38J1]QGZ14006.1 hypothetical protein RL38J1_256 [Rhizobium phage RL38J1]
MNNPSSEERTKLVHEAYKIVKDFKLSELTHDTYEANYDELIRCFSILFNCNDPRFSNMPIISKEFGSECRELALEIYETATRLKVQFGNR